MFYWFFTLTNAHTHLNTPTQTLEIIQINDLVATHNLIEWHSHYKIISTCISVLFIVCLLDLYIDLCGKPTNEFDQIEPNIFSNQIEPKCFK